VTNDKREPPKTEKCPTCGGEAKLDERRYTEQDQVAYSCRNGLSHYFFVDDPRLEVRRLRSELDRAKKVVEAAREVDCRCPEGFDDQDGWTNDAHRKMHFAIRVFDAPTENK
jgi:hypothetical protein